MWSHLTLRNTNRTKSWSWQTITLWPFQKNSSHIVQIACRVYRGSLSCFCGITRWLASHMIMMMTSTKWQGSCVVKWYCTRLPTAGPRFKYTEQTLKARFNLHLIAYQLCPISSALHVCRPADSRINPSIQPSTVLLTMVIMSGPRVNLCINQPTHTELIIWTMPSLCRQNDGMITLWILLNFAIQKASQII